eukprot:TRINITY_DN3451_c0_g2_i3.p1 TRINITY_DN3451_c0_g2~~TRINITY_DN3451_c0_g2_i3.p1  ORF type:complete len:339 (+),score=56.30 TRINITY_DN3451_c0_g2_i3:394-1410(+)
MLPELFPKKRKLKMLLPQQKAQLQFTRIEVACLLANAYLSTYDNNNNSYTELEMDGFRFFGINFSTLWLFSSSNISIIANDIHHETITFKRCPITILDTPDWLTSSKPVCLGNVLPHTTVEEDQESNIHVCLSRKYQGGEVLGTAAGVEEILFCERPECIVSLLVSAPMQFNESFIVSGTKRYSTTEGMYSDVVYSGEDLDNVLDISLVIVDQLVSWKSDRYKPDNLIRELNRYYSGLGEWKYKLSELPALAAGYDEPHFHHKLTSILLLLVCSEVGIQYRYHCYGNEEFAFKLQNLFEMMFTTKKTVGEVYIALTEYLEHSDNMDEFQFLAERLNLE